MEEIKEKGKHDVGDGIILLVIEFFVLSVIFSVGKLVIENPMQAAALATAVIVIVLVVYANKRWVAPIIDKLTD